MTATWKLIFGGSSGSGGFIMMSEVKPSYLAGGFEKAYPLSMYEEAC